MLLPKLAAPELIIELIDDSVRHAGRATPVGGEAHSGLPQRVAPHA